MSVVLNRGTPIVNMKVQLSNDRQAMRFSYDAQKKIPAFPPEDYGKLIELISSVIHRQLIRAVLTTLDAKIQQAAMWDDQLIFQDATGSTWSEIDTQNKADL